MTWYQKLICALKVHNTGTVMQVLASYLATGLFSGDPKKQGSLDTSVAQDVTRWFHGQFKPWFEQVTKGQRDFTSAEYIDQFNRILQGLHVSRSYYAKQASQEYMSSLQAVAQWKANICEELAAAMIASYEAAGNRHGFEVATINTITESSSYQGSLPESFKWKEVIEVYHPIISSVSTPSADQVPDPEEKQPVPGEIRTIVKKSNTPWIVAAAFGLIAWRASGSKKKKD